MAQEPPLVIIEFPETFEVCLEELHHFLNKMKIDTNIKQARKELFTRIGVNKKGEVEVEKCQDVCFIFYCKKKKN